MKCKIEITNGVKYLKGIDNNKLYEVSDYIELHESSLVMIGLIIDSKEYYYWGKNHIQYTKLWGCIDSMMNVVVPFIYQRMQRELNCIRAEKEVGYNRVFESPEYASYYFNQYGVPVIYSTKKEMVGWDWVKDSDCKCISIAQKDGKQGVVRNDGSVFVEPIYKKVEIDFSNPEIIVTSDDNIRTSIVYRKDKKSWRFLPVGHRYIYFSDDLYVLVNQNDLEYAVDKNFNIVVLPCFDSILVYPQYIVVKINGKTGILSREKTTIINGIKNPIYAPVTKIEFDDIKIQDNKAIVVKNSLQGVVDLRNGYTPITKIEFDDVKILGNRAIVIKNSLQGIINLENGDILCFPCIPIEYQILPYTLNDNAIAFKTTKRQYGYFDLDGHLLFEIKIEDDKINESSIGAFKNGKVHLYSNKYQYVFNKDGSYERIRIVQRYWGETYHNYDAERWDALTDGMEGDYPGSGVDYDMLGFD